MRSHDSILGCIYGGAIGDCLGGSFEGQRRPALSKQNRAWRLSDDTLLTLATCQAIAERGAVDPETIAATFGVWFREGRLVGLGASTYKALSELAHGGHWALVGAKGERSAGNGAAMRVAPLAFLLDPSDDRDRQTIRDVCRITHHNDEAYAGALAVVIAVRMAARGEWTGATRLLEQIALPLPDTNVRDRLRELAKLPANMPLGEIATRYGSSGYVVESVPLAISGAARLDAIGFEPLLNQLIACGGDTDTIASIAGQIAGTALGKLNLPTKLMQQLPDQSLIEQIAQSFATIITNKPD